MLFSGTRKKYKDTHISDVLNAHESESTANYFGNSLCLFGMPYLCQVIYWNCAIYCSYQPKFLHNRRILSHIGECILKIFPWDILHLSLIACSLWRTVHFACKSNVFIRFFFFLEKMFTKISFSRRSLNWCKSFWEKSFTQYISFLRACKLHGSGKRMSNL